LCVTGHSQKFAEGGARQQQNLFALVNNFLAFSYPLQTLSVQENARTPMTTPLVHY